MRTTTLITCFLSICFATISAKAQTIVNLYTDIPNSIKNDLVEKIDTVKKTRLSGVTIPTITAYLPDPKIANGTAVLICPGGGYTYLVVNMEGRDIALELNKKGIAAFVLKYRLPSPQIMVNTEIGPLQDAQQGMKLIRENASKWNINPNKVGIMGFSAGGHLAATASVMFERKLIENKLNTNLRPDFSVLVYPVISFTDSLVHVGSKTKLIGEKASAEKVIAYSAELQVKASCPPAFLVHSSNDKVVPVANSINYYLALQKLGIKAELHIYQAGGHGYGLNNPTTKDKWIESCYNWMLTNKWL
ncbi:alpha/beta hydrolase [Pedobacter frigiditerrae]|uniref:alpha/beta hydrolase n=1 Tax=Pedobacter frigiditerrae TaxID=2530452 RepID=UPI00292EF372|nr:alpha/beta hydrolase [Pedobacter frigiditerrae]